MVPTFISYFTGYLTITVSGRFCERFINVCTNHNILLWDIKKISANSIRCKISVSGFRKLPEIAYNTGVSVHINIKHGFPFFLNRYRNRKIALFSIFIFLICVIIANQFVWGIEVRGNYKIPAERIISVLNDAGLTVGSKKSEINQQELKKESLLAIPELSWLWVDKKGSKVIVDVREKIETPEILSPNEYYNIVAKKDAIIKEMTVKDGVPVVENGDTVLAGTVLVTGKIPVPSKQFTRYVRASACVHARVWYEKKELFSKISTTRHETGKHATQYTLDFFGAKIKLFHNDSAPFKEYDVSEKKYSFLGISVIKKSYDEIILEKELLTEESVANYGAQQLLKQIEEEVSPDSQQISFEFSHREVNDSTVEVTVKAEYLEDIAEAVKGEILNDSETEDLN